MENTKFLDYNGLSKLVEKIKNTYVNKNEQYEANLKWGGGNFAGSFGPIDAAMVPELGANRFAFGDPKGITIEYSNDGGSTWLDYGASDDQKLRLTSTSTSFNLGKSSSVPPSTLNKLRITFDTLRTTEGGIGCYAELSKFYIRIRTKGMNDCYCTIQLAKNTENITYNEIATKVPISGWTGDNIINVPKFITAYTSNDRNYIRKIRFIFGADSIYSDTYSNMEINVIQAFGGTGWDLPSTMADIGRLYKYDSYQNATFPANVTANNFIGKINNFEIAKSVPADAVFTDKNVYQISDNTTTSILPLLMSPITEDTKADEVHQTTNAKYNFAIGAVPSEGKIKATIFDGTTFTGNAATATNAITATYAKQYSYGGTDRDFVYDAIDGVNHYIKCKDTTIIRANATNLSRYAFIVNADANGGFYIYDSKTAKGTTWGPDGIAFEKAPANSLVAANGTFITAITDTEIQNEIDKAITL